MTAEQHPAGASSNEDVKWHDLKWSALHRNVGRLQARIVKATKEKRWNKVRALQHLLTHSFSGKAIAVRRVTENQGKKTPGVDEVLWNTPDKKMAAVHSLKRRGYKPMPLKRVYIPKANGKMRPLGIPTTKDRAMQALHHLGVTPVSETTADQNSFGFREERSCADAIVQCYISLAKSKSPEWILEGDIKSCFDRINHDWLLANIPMDKVILRKWLKSGYMENTVFYETEDGTPQGGVISPVLANMALDGLQELLARHFPKQKWISGAKKGKEAWTYNKVNLVRYADDFIITGRSKEQLEKEVKPIVEEFLRERGLELSKEKTKVTHIQNGFDFLGVNIRKYGTKGKYMSKPSKKNLLAFLGKVRKAIKDNKAATAKTMVGILNPIIRGWTYYHRHGAASRSFSYVDKAVFKALWQWAKRRHPGKGRHWIKEKYFGTVGGNHWVFYGVEDGRKYYLYQAVSTPIKRHVKIQGEANPYDPQWETYFEKRMDVKMVNNVKGHRKLLYLWRQQDGKCPICDQRITKITQWHQHHLVYRSHGGGDQMSNLILLHPNCHNQLHAKGLSVSKPRPAMGR